MANVFKNFGHFIASGAKDFVKFAQEAAKVLKIIEAQEPVIDSVLNVINPAAGAIADIGFHLIGDVAAALEAAGNAVGSNGLDITLDKETVLAVQQILNTVKNLQKAKGITPPGVTPNPTASAPTPVAVIQ